MSKVVNLGTTDDTTDYEEPCQHVKEGDIPKQKNIAYGVSLQQQMDELVTEENIAYTAVTSPEEIPDNVYEVV